VEVRRVVVARSEGVKLRVGLDGRCARGDAGEGFGAFWKGAEGFVRGGLWRRVIAQMAVATL